MTKPWSKLQHIHKIYEKVYSLVLIKIRLECILVVLIISSIKHAIGHKLAIFKYYLLYKNLSFIWLSVKVRARQQAIFARKDL